MDDGSRKCFLGSKQESEVRSQKSGVRSYRRQLYRREQITGVEADRSRPLSRFDLGRRKAPSDPRIYADKAGSFRCCAAQCAKLCAWGGDEWREGTESISEILFFGCRISPRALYCRSTGAIATIKADLSDFYRDYIACLNKQDWPKLEQFVHDEVYYNGQRIGILGYREMLEKDFYEIPDLHFDIQLLIFDPPYVASRLEFDCTPKGKFLGLHVNGRRVSFTENVFYEFRREKIWQVWSVIDKAAIEAQL